MLFLVAAGEIPVVIKDWLILVKSNTYWCYEKQEMMHHVVPRGTALCGATLCPEVKSCRIMWCVIQREHVVEK